jgi:hypothetical protein
MNASCPTSCREEAERQRRLEAEAWRDGFGAKARAHIERARELALLAYLLEADAARETTQQGEHCHETQ